MLPNQTALLTHRKQTPNAVTPTISYATSLAAKTTSQTSPSPHLPSITGSNSSTTALNTDDNNVYIGGDGEGSGIRLQWFFRLKALRHIRLLFWNADGVLHRKQGCRNCCNTKELICVLLVKLISFSMSNSIFATF
jgi:hypothetical protein